MKLVFLVVSLLLGLASVGIWLTQPDLASDKPVIYWVTDRNPARELQVERFHQWLVHEGHVDEHGKPIVELRLDMANAQVSKIAIQSVSGVASDLIDTYGESMRLLQAMGVLTDLTEDAEAMGFGPNSTYDAMGPDLMVDGRQYRYPANVSVNLMWVNPELLQRYGLDPPPPRWTWADFEQLGVAFKKAANSAGTRPADRKFISSHLMAHVFDLTNGVDPLNETLTGSALNNPAWIESLKTRKRWIYELNILPTPDDVAAAPTEQGFGRSALQLFGREQYAMLPGGRYMLVQLRRYSQIRELDVVEVPHNTFPAAFISTRAVALYKGSKHPELAKLFLAFLASEAYSQTIVEDADALPPNPEFTRGEAFRSPSNYPREHGVHEIFADAAETIAVSMAYSPYVLPSIINRERNNAEQAYFNNRLTAEQAAEQAARLIDRQIQAELYRKPELLAAYARDAARQRVLEELKAEGKPLPETWIKNPVHRAYYQAKGRLTDQTPPEPTPVVLPFDDEHAVSTVNESAS
ncbi:MAG: extracellular solute-binding protein [Planctomycetota bacterium]